MEERPGISAFGSLGSYYALHRQRSDLRQGPPVENGLASALKALQDTKLTLISAQQDIKKSTSIPRKQREPKDARVPVVRGRSRPVLQEPARPVLPAGYFEKVDLLVAGKKRRIGAVFFRAMVDLSASKCR